MKQKLYFSIVTFLLIQNYSYGYDYLPDDMRLDQVLLINAHNIGQSKAYGWRYYQQLGTVQQQWNAGARGGKLNLHWRRPISPTTQIKEQLERTKVGKVTKKAISYAGKLVGGKGEKKKNRASNLL